MEGPDIEGVLKAAVRRVRARYPDTEWNDLEAQAYLIVTEVMPEYKKERSSLSTYLHNRISYGLSDYIRRSVLKEQHMNGRREYLDEELWHLEAEPKDSVGQVEARITLSEMLEQEEGVTRDVLKLMMQGYNQSEVATELGLSKQRISQYLEKVREKYS